VVPTDVVALRQVLEAPRPSRAYSRHCRGIMLAELVALHCRAHAHGVLSITDQDAQHGAIHIEGGEIVHANFGSLIGPAAITAMLQGSESHASWLAGDARSPRTVLGRWQSLLTGPDLHHETETAGEHVHSVVVERISRLAQTPDILGAFLLHDRTVVAGSCRPGLDPSKLGGVLVNLSEVAHALESARAEQELQCVVAELRFVVDRVGPPELGYSVGVVVRPASAVCKSLRRLLRQIDRAFRRSLNGSRAPDSPRPHARTVELLSSVF
jgi:hypothetical protein